MRHLSNILFAILLCIVALVNTAHADDYPARPVELIVPFPAGGVTDVVARAFAASAASYFAQPIVVLNKPGASGTIGMAEIAASKPDGYKITMVVPELLTAQRMGIGKLSFHDLQLLARVTSSPATLTVRADSQWRSLDEFIGHARRNPGKVTVGTSGPGSMHNIVVSALNQIMDINLVRIPYQGEAPAVVGLLGGQVDATTIGFIATGQHISAGKLRVLGVMADKRAAGFESVPTFKEKNIDLTFSVWQGLATARKTPPEIIQKLTGLIEKVVADANFQAALRTQNIGLSYEDGVQFQDSLAREDDLLKKLLPNVEVGK